jgi:hypothetical protein
MSRRASFTATLLTLPPQISSDIPQITLETSQSLPEFGSLSKLDARVGFSEKSLLAI